jgi:putative phosphoesterase
LPESIAEIFAGVDLILHAGDIGDLGVIRELETIAPVIAVHGNDEPEQTVDSLAFQRIVDLEGSLTLLMHGNDSDAESERRVRREDRWDPKLDYWAARGAEVGASIVVYGHTHVPLTRNYDGLFLVNPGALASGSLFCRQTIRSVALMLVEEDKVEVAHVNVDRPEPSTSMPP